MNGGHDDVTISQSDFPVPSLVGGPHTERFTIVRRLGEGGMAVVYEAIDTKLGEKRALKFSKSGHAHSIPPEARAALRVTHENVCRTFEIHSAQTTDGPADFISMEYVEGETLAARWRREPLAQQEALEIARQLCRGVIAAHEADVLHLDLKSSNVMLSLTASGNLRVIVMDFGLAQAFQKGSGSDSSRLGGTPNYIAPERYLGAASAPANDIYALGVILYEMLTGQLPYPKGTDLQAKLYTPPVAPSKAGGRAVDRRWDQVILRCLESNPGKRIASARDLLEAIEEAFAPSRRKLWAAGATIILAASAVWWFWPEPPLARLAVLPFAGSTGDKTLDGTLQGGLAEVSERLESLGAASRRLVLIRPDVAARYQVTTSEKAGGQLSATHVLSGSVHKKGQLVAVHAEVRAVATGDLLRKFDAEFPVAELAGISTSLAGVVTSAFRLGKALPAEVKPEAYPFYAFGLGLLQKDRTSYDRALEQFKTALEFDSTSPLILSAQVTALLQKFRATQDGQWLQEAATVAANAERLHPDSPAVLQGLGEIEREGGRPEKATEYYNRAIALEPNRSEAWRLLGLALDKMEKYEEGVAAVRKAIELAPGYFAPYATMGMIQFQRGRVNESVEAYRRMTELAPQLPEAWASYAGSLTRAERDAEAETALRQSLKLRDSRQARNNLGVLLRYQHRDAEAVEEFHKAVNTGADTIPMRMNLGAVLKKLGRQGEARVQFARAAELARAALLRNPRDASARAQLGYIQVEAGERQTGLDNAMQAAQLDPTQYTVLFWVSMTAELLGKRELVNPLLQAAPVQQLKDLRRQPDLQEFVKDPRFNPFFATKNQP